MLDSYPFRKTIIDLCKEVYDRPYDYLTRQEKDVLIELSHQRDEDLKKEILNEIDNRILSVIRKIESYKQKRRNVISETKYNIKPHLDHLKMFDYIRDYNLEITFKGYKYLNVHLKILFPYDRLMINHNKTYRIGIASYREKCNAIIMMLENVIIRSPNVGLRFGKENYE